MEQENVKIGSIGKQYFHAFPYMISGGAAEMM